MPVARDTLSAAYRIGYTAGDHDLFIAEVVAVAADDESFDGFWNIETEAGRLLHHLGADRYAGLAYQYRATTPEPEEEG